MTILAIVIAVAVALSVGACVWFGVGACALGHAWKTEDIPAGYDHRYCTRCYKCQWKVKNTTNWITV